MTAYDIIKKPIITEKSELIRKNFNKFTFEVDRRANKLEIRSAVEAIFGVKVEEVTTLNIKPKNKRHGQRPYVTTTKKKAVVKLKDGDTIKYFQGV